MRKVILSILFAVFLFFVSQKVAFSQSCTVDSFGNITNDCGAGYVEQISCDNSPSGTGLCYACACVSSKDPKATNPPINSPGNFIQPTETKESAIKCKDGSSGISTALGCIRFDQSTTTSDLIGFILNWAIGVAGGIAFLLIIYGGFQVMTSSGDPQRLKAGQELLTAAISGLVMLIFSVFILRVIGVDILGIF